MQDMSTIEIQVLSTEYIETIKSKKSKGYYFFKRLFAIISSFLFIIVVSPILIIFAFLVKITSKGPILFKDIRIGKGGKHIKVWKFRSMYYDAETNIEKYLNEEQIEQWKQEKKIDNDPRVTKLGRFMRRTSIDELPQLFNILTGRIAIVGPRPITTKEYGHYSKEEIQLLTSTRPGLTGIWQVYGRSKVTYSSGERQKMDMAYFEKRSLLFDLKIIFLTIPAVFKGDGAE